MPGCDSLAPGFPRVIPRGCDVVNHGHPQGKSGGETAAKARLQGWMWDRDCLQEYFETRNGMLGADYSSKLAPWLAQAGLLNQKPLKKRDVLKLLG